MQGKTCLKFIGVCAVDVHVFNLKVEHTEKKQPGWISQHTISSEAPWHHMVVFTASTTLRSKVTGFTSGRGSTQTVTARAHTLTHAHNLCPGAWTTLTAGMRPAQMAPDRSQLLPFKESSLSLLPPQGTCAVYPQVTPVQLREHPVPGILLAHLTSPKRGGPFLLDTQRSHKVCQRHISLLKQTW